MQCVCVVVEARRCAPVERVSSATRRALESESVSALRVLRYHAQLRAAGAPALRRQGAPAAPPQAAETTAATGSGSSNRVT